MFLLTTVVQKAVSRGLHAPSGPIELGGPTTSRAQMSRISSLFLLVGAAEHRGCVQASQPAAQVQFLAFPPKEFSQIIRNDP